MRCDEGKTRYPTLDVAQEMVTIIQSSRQRRGKAIPDLRVYPCPFCKFWHLTSQPKLNPAAHWKSGGNRDLAARLMRRARETPLFDRLVREYNLKGKAFR